MCIFPTLAVKICVLVIIPISSALCMAEIVVSIMSLSSKKNADALVYLLLVVSLLYLIALGVGYYGSFVLNIVCLQVMLFVIAGDLLIKVFIACICSYSSEGHQELNTNFWFRVFFFGSFISTMLCFLFAFLYFLRVKEILDDDG